VVFCWGQREGTDPVVGNVEDGLRILRFEVAPASTEPGRSKVNSRQVDGSLQ
jgi:hypothetical protein